MTTYRKGTKVSWKWGNGKGEGKVAESFTEDVERKIDGSTISARRARMSLPI